MKYKHPAVGYKHTEASKKKLSKARQEKSNPNWKGNKVGYSGLHAWVKRRKPKPKRCEKCQKKKPLDLANISQEYKRDLNDWEWLCRSCHTLKDRRNPVCSNCKRKLICPSCGKVSIK